MTDKEVQELFEQEFLECAELEDILQKLDTMESHPAIEDLRICFDNYLLDCITFGFTHYLDFEKFQKNDFVQAYLENTEKMPKSLYYFWSLYYFFTGQNNKCITAIKAYLRENDGEHTRSMDLNEFFYAYVSPFKNACSGFWDTVLQQLRAVHVDADVLAHCELIQAYYLCQSVEEEIDLLTDFLQKHPDSVAAKELLGQAYYAAKMWRNAIAYFEAVEDPMVFVPAEISFSIAWAYGQCKDRKNEERYYRNCLELDPQYLFARNNLAYCLYFQKRYAEAQEILEECLEKKVDLSNCCVPNNYVRVLLALGKTKEAVQFIKKGEFKVSKSLAERAEKQLNCAKDRIKSNNAATFSDDYIEKEENAVSNKTMISGYECSGKATQFSNERLLEEELTARIESGMPVFGKRLKIFRRKGEYGRQYIIPIGRLDLLCEDSDGNLYVIELKKDGGYDDAYAQTAAYLNWFEKSKRFAKQKVSGIICVNNPGETLMEKVHADPRMQLFEYQISYKEC